VVHPARAAAMHCAPGQSSAVNVAILCLLLQLRCQRQLLWHARDAGLLQLDVAVQLKQKPTVR
jgi:hypothetical protein